MKRWLRFNAAGILGAGIQLAVLDVMLHFHVHYLLATAVAIEIALLHNHAWRRRRTGAMGLPPLPSNLAAITLTSFLNYALASTWVFAHLDSPGYDVNVRQGH